MRDEDDFNKVKAKYRALKPHMDERVKRCWAASEARAIGWGGISMVARVTGLSRTTIQQGMKEISSADKLVALSGVRCPGGGRRKLSVEDRKLVRDLKYLVESSTRGDPQSPLLWTSKSTRNLADELSLMQHQVSYKTVGRVLKDLGYSLQSNRKAREGESHPDRDAQFIYINKKVKCFQKHKQPVVSVDTKKKELIGNYKNSGQEWRQKARPLEVKSKDFPDQKLGKVIPYGVYDITHDDGWVSVGIDHDTAEFAVESIRRWWLRMGCVVYPDAQKLLITADAGGSNASRSRLWKVSLQRLADEFGLEIMVCHYPPGTSKWNKIEHRMFCHITENWRSRPLISRAVVVNLIGNTKTRAGLKVKAQLDLNPYPIGQKISDEQFAAVNVKKHNFHGDWNYSIAPY